MFGSNRMKICTLMIALMLTHSRAEDKKIGLEDIEQDNLKSERVKDEGSNNEYEQQEQTYVSHRNPTHQYDVEENNVQDSPGVVYASNNINYQTNGHQYVESNAPTGYQSQQFEGNQNSIDQNMAEPAPQNYASQYPMQIIYVQQYENAPSHMNAYHVPALYYQSIATGPGTASDAEGKYSGKAQGTGHDSHVNYVSVPVLTQIPGYVVPQYQEQENFIQKVHPLQNYASYVNHQPYTTAIDKEQIKYIAPPVHNVYESKPVSISQHSPHDPIPRVLPQYAHEVSRPIYSHISGNLVSDHHHHQQSAYYDNGHHIPQKYANTIPDPYKLGYGQFTHRKPNSLLESYIPSAIQIEYLKRGLSKDPLATYDAVAHTQGFPVNNFETGFLPNQMYATAGGGVTFGHFKRYIKTKDKN